MTPEEFERWLADGPKRAPLLYGGKIKHEAVGAPPVEKKSDSVAMRTIGEQSAKIDWRSKAAGEEWDGVEE